MPHSYLHNMQIQTVTPHSSVLTGFSVHTVYKHSTNVLFIAKRGPTGFPLPLTIRTLIIQPSTVNIARKFSELVLPENYADFTSTPHRLHELLDLRGFRLCNNPELNSYTLNPALYNLTEPGTNPCNTLITPLYKAETPRLEPRSSQRSIGNPPKKQISVPNGPNTNIVHA